MLSNVRSHLKQNPSHNDVWTQDRLLRSTSYSSLACYLRKPPPGLQMPPMIIDPTNFPSQPELMFTGVC